MTDLAEEIGELLAYLTPAETKELDAHLLALQPVAPHSEWQHDPIGWAEHKLLVPRHTIEWSLNSGYVGRAWDGTPDPLATMFRALAEWDDDHRTVTVESCTGGGKSFGAAILVLWFIACWEGGLVWTFALNERQLQDYIWRNIRELWPRFQSLFPTATLSALEIRMRGGMDNTWGAQSKAVQLRAGETVASRAQGMHGKDMLLVYEEAAAMEWSIVQAGRDTCTAPHNLRLFIGNPISQSDSLHRVSKQAGVTPIRCSALDHPNVVTGNADIVAGAASRQSIKERLLDCDGNEQDPIYLSRVRGISPEQSANALIRLEWLKASNDRWQARRAITHHYGDSDRTDESDYVSENAALYPDHFLHRSANPQSRASITTPVIRPLSARVTGRGVDVANSEHGDKASICDFADNAVVRHDAFPCPDANVLGATVAQDLRAFELPDERCGVDATGVGAGTVNELRRRHHIVIAIYFGNPAQTMVEKLPDGRTEEWAPDANLFASSGGLRSQMYWQLREDLRRGTIDMPGKIGCALWEELTAFTFAEYPKTVVCPTEDIKKLVGRSPDLSSSLVIANWVRKRAFKPSPRDVPVGRSMGFDPETQRGRTRPTGQSLLDEWTQEESTNTTRYVVPYRDRGPHR